MTETQDESNTASDSRTEIMDATYRALCEHGHADLTMQQIADEAGKSTSLLHYHFDTKEELLVAFIDHLITEFEATVAPDEDESPTERLRQFLDLWVLEPDETDRTALHLALLELRSRGPFNEAYREQLARSDELLRTTVAEIVQDGIEQDVFREVDPEGTARLIVATLDGARTRQITLDDPEYTRGVREQLEEQFVEGLLVSGETNGR
ncbi:TetR/AcrR family transcriptional regulator [Natranaeroarchaeum sulfidigenes]|uniref:Transcriptional regulator, TetR/AcrR family n=1 Tax=Natranaeroarchaeum sulfidigenes TaxID=2784880 RepID=A0A897MU25_9EURY|nr:TetR/AcrR family transcriptional regulator [Natranaeroarchaeum sulfidigenes]QSG03538.1 Transcriptional regulator, TetR/AcrR family [Natranaeroarchaeum sulfidigenes]